MHTCAWGCSRVHFPLGSGKVNKWRVYLQQLCPDLMPSYGMVATHSSRGGCRRGRREEMLLAVARLFPQGRSHRDAFTEIVGTDKAAPQHFTVLALGSPSSLFSSLPLAAVASSDFFFFFFRIIHISKSKNQEEICLWTSYTWIYPACFQGELGMQAASPGAVF